MKVGALKKAGLGVGLVYAAAYALQSARVNLKHFNASDFGLWWPLMSPELLLNLDNFRELLGVPVVLSPAAGSIGRLPGPGVRDNSEHIPSPLIDAVDVMPKGVSLHHAYRVARQVGFHAIGLYPDWKPRPGMHLGMRSSRSPENPALWSARMVAGVQTYGAIERGLS